MKIEYATMIERMERILGAYKVVLWDDVARGCMRPGATFVLISWDMRTSAPGAFVH